MGPEYLKAAAAKTGVPLLSANVCDRAGRLVGDPLRIVAAAERNIALVGVLAERYATAEIDVAPPCPAVLDALRTAPAPYDAVIVLAYLPEDELRQLAAALPEADAIVGGPTGQPVSPKMLGPTLLTSATNMGKFLVRLDAPLPGKSDRWTGSITELSDKFADDPRLAANLAAFRAVLRSKDIPPEQTSFAGTLWAGGSNGFGDCAIVGNAACVKCHDEDCRLWAASPHAKAWEALKPQDAQADPDCQRCHTTGYGLPGGFASLRKGDKRTAVGCESCHGPSRAHAAKEEVHTSYYAQARNHCIDCHDRENSPAFDYDQYWKKIEHGTESKEDGDSQTKASKRGPS